MLDDFIEDHGKKVVVAVVVIAVIVVIIIVIRRKKKKTANYPQYATDYGIHGGRLDDPSCPYCADPEALGSVKLIKRGGASLTPSASLAPGSDCTEEEAREPFFDEFMQNVPLNTGGATVGLGTTSGSVFYGFGPENVQQFYQGVDGTP